MHKPNKLDKARVQLILNHPFYASLLLGQEMILTDVLPDGCFLETMAVSHTHLFINPDYVERELNLQQVIFALAHEMGHLAFGHLKRGESLKDQDLANKSGDYVINELLVMDGVGEIHPTWLKDSRIFRSGGETMEGVYYYLLKNPPPQKSKSQDKMQFAPPGGGGQNEGEQESQLKQRIAQAAMAAKMAGKLSETLSQFVNDTLHPEPGWREKLWEIADKSIGRGSEKSYTRLARRQTVLPALRPGRLPDEPKEIFCLVDVSSSVDIDVVKKVFGELRSISDNYGRTQVKGATFNTKIMETFDEPPPSVRVGGGTDFETPLLYAEECGAELIVMLTDGECNNFGLCPSAKVVWIIYGGFKNFSPPFGEVIFYEEEKK